MLVLLLLALPLCLGDEQTKPALQEEVDVLVYGTLQLGQAMRDTYSSTAKKLHRIVGKQGQQEQTIGRLQEKISKARQERRRLYKEVGRLQREDHERRTTSNRIEGDLQEIRRGYVELQRRIHDLEKGVQVQEGIIPGLKDRVDQHGLILQVLNQEHMRQEKQMTKQKEQLIYILKRASAIGRR
ncbi:angiopoietin-like protein 8 [Mixophyes fleayi]|uniref:angiopoietin-like protein 8 n=1 Tax=Mixophyes fleayi TaxID=3061075 RepID=UPI003F4D855B